MRRTVMLIMVTLLILPALAQSATRYVDSTAGACTGNYSIANRNCTGSDGDSYVTLQAGANATVAPGDVLLVREGKYPLSAYLTFPQSGTPDNRITIASYPSEVVTVISGAQLALVYLEYGRSYITIQGFKFNAANVTGNAIYIGDGITPSTGITLTENEIYNAPHGSGTGMGIMVRKAPYTSIIRNSLHHLGNHCLYHSSGTYALIEQNLIHTCYGSGIQMRKTPSNAATYNSHSIIRYNRIYNANTHVGGGLYGVDIATGTNIQLYGNIIESNNGGSGPNGGAGVFVSNFCKSCKVYNNSIYNNNIGLRLWHNASNTTVVNNLILGNRAATLNQSTSTKYKTNVMSGSVGTYWVDAPGRKFNQIPTAPSINVGTVTPIYCPAPCSQGAHQVPCSTPVTAPEVPPDVPLVKE